MQPLIQLILKVRFFHYLPLFLQILMSKNDKIHSQGLWNCNFFYEIVWYFIFFCIFAVSFPNAESPWGR